MDEESESVFNLEARVAGMEGKLDQIAGLEEKLHQVMRVEERLEQIATPQFVKCGVHLLETSTRLDLFE